MTDKVRESHQYHDGFSDGFEPVGQRSNTLWFFLHHWYRNFQSRVFAARQGDCIAVTYKLRDWDSWRLCFATAFSDGAILQTANQMEITHAAEFTTRSASSDPIDPSRLTQASIAAADGGYMNGKSRPVSGRG